MKKLLTVFLLCAVCVTMGGCSYLQDVLPWLKDKVQTGFQNESTDPYPSATKNNSPVTPEWTAGPAAKLTPTPAAGPAAKLTPTSAAGPAAKLTPTPTAGPTIKLTPTPTAGPAAVLTSTPVSEPAANPTAAPAAEPADNTENSEPEGIQFPIHE